MKNILLISGSLRAKSINTALLRTFAEELADQATVAWADINLPLFNEDIEADFPASAEALRQQILDADAIVIASPEYNRAMTGGLKNALDWGSRPYGKNAWAGKRTLVVSASPGGVAGALGMYQVKQTLLHLDAEVLGKPEFMVGGAYEKFNEAGELTDEKTRERVQAAVATLLA